MSINKFDVSLEGITNKERNINYELLKFLNGKSFTYETDHYSLSQQHLFEFPYDIYSLFKDEEYIRTTANEVPKSNGGWGYNHGYTYDIIYALLEGNKLLVIEIQQRIDSFPGDPYYVKFKLFHDVEKYYIMFKEGHRQNVPYLNVMNSEDTLISEFYFEMPVRKYNERNTKLLNEVLPSVGIQDLVSRYKDMSKEKEYKINK